LLVVPLLLVAGFFLSGIGTGENLFSQYMDATRLDDYFKDGEQSGHNINGFFLIPAFFFSWYVLSLLAKLWAGQHLQLFGKIGLNTSQFLSIRSWNAVGYLIFLWVLPYLFMVANWLYEPLGLALLLLVAIVFLSMHSNSKAEKERIQQSGGRSKWKMAMIGLMITVVARLAFEIYSLTEGVDWNDTLPNRGWIEFSYYLVIGVLFFGLPIVAQLFSAHNLPRFTLKSLVLAGLGIWFALAPMRIGGQQKTNWLKEPPRLNQLSGIFTGLISEAGEEEVGDPSPEIPGVFLAQISNGFEAINVRKGQSTKTDVRGQAAKGQLFLVQSDARNGWWWITTANGLQGYMHNSKIDKIRTAREVDLLDFPDFQPPVNAAQPETENSNSAVPEQVLNAIPEPTSVPAPIPASLQEKDVERLLNRMANPSHPRSTKQQAEDQLLPLFAGPESPVFFLTSQGRRKTGHKEIQSYLLELKLTGRYRIKIEEMQVQNGKITKLVVYQRKR
ncbi:MAG: SH3 domain-containing protein, partial [Bacteroidota bacterium]